MEIHNVMEDVVRSMVNELFDQEDAKKNLSYCTCYQCRMDVACYVLNRMKPEYVISSRGAVHKDKDYGETLQRGADVISLVKEGWSKIDQTKRPHFEHHSGQERPELPAGPVYNFPSIMGRIFNGQNFEPLSGVLISLMSEGQLVRMIDPNWQNPCNLVANTAGTFIYWPYPETAKEPGSRKTFTFVLKALVPGFEDLEHYFEFELVSEQEAVDQFTIQRVHKLPDLYVFPR